MDETNLPQDDKKVPVVIDATVENDRNAVFSALVKGDADITGLVAYSIYKQNKLDWLQAFEKVKGREPAENELISYIVGESTPRRIATYRHLAEATLAGNGPKIEGQSASDSFVTRNYAAAAKANAGQGSTTPSSVAAYAALALVLLIGFWLLAKFGMKP